MKKMMLALALSTGLAMASTAAAADTNNWTPPASKIYGQTLSGQTMNAHFELLSVTLHGVAPGTPDAYTMVAGSHPERTGNNDDPYDIDVSKKGITIVDPRWHRAKDDSPNFADLMPMRDAKDANIGLIVYAFRVPVAGNQYERSTPRRSICAMRS